MRLGTKVALLSVTQTVVPLAVVGFLASYSSQATIERHTLRHLADLTTLKASELERWVQGNGQLLRSLAERPSLEEEAAELVSHAAADPEYRAAHDRLIKEHLAPNIGAGMGFLSLSILRVPDGLIIASTDRTHEGDRESEPFFLDGQHGTYVQNVTYSVQLGTAVMHISTPIKAEDGSVIAVLAGHADLAEVGSIMAQGRTAGSSIATYLVNSFDFFVTAARSESNYPLKRAVHTAAVDDCLEHHDGSGLYDDYRGIPLAARAGAVHPDRD